MDGSIHDWFGDKKVCLMNMVDDATSKSYGLFDTRETTYIALRSLYEWIKRYGIPKAIYSDKRKISRDYVVRKENRIYKLIRKQNINI